MSIYFLFLESLGTPELVLIMLVALIVFGPRKLPTIGRTIGKYTAEFKRASQDFRETWEREVREAEADIKGDVSTATTESLAKLEADFAPNPNGVENTIGRASPWARTSETNDFVTAPPEVNTIAPPQVKAVENADFNRFANGNSNHQEAETVEVAAPPRKRDWL